MTLPAHLVELILAVALLGVGAPAHGTACEQRAGDVLPAELACAYVAASLIAAGYDPAQPFDWTACERGPCRSRLAEHMRFLRCESNLDPRAYDEGWVGVDFHGAPVWNRSRGIAQFGDGWEHVATDAEAYDWRWSVRRLAADQGMMDSYPECGPKARR